jgi:hypothetical protein
MGWGFMGRSSRPNHSSVGVAEISDSDDDVIFQVGLGSVGHPNKLDGGTMIRDSN